VVKKNSQTISADDDTNMHLFKYVLPYKNGCIGVATQKAVVYEYDYKMKQYKTSVLQNKVSLPDTILTGRFLQGKSNLLMVDMTAESVKFILTDISENALAPFAEAILSLKGVQQVLPIDYDNDGLDEVLVLLRSGEYYMYQFENKTFVKKAEGKQNDWVNANVQLCAGRFIAKNKMNLLTIHQNSSLSSVYEFNGASFNKVLQGPLFTGIYDTLHVVDSYWAVDVDHNGVDELICYKNGWRYNMKLLSITKQDGAAIKWNIDFKGYEKDFNPKYYETLQIIPMNDASFLLLMRNAKEVSWLPAAVDVYSLKK